MTNLSDYTCSSLLPENDLMPLYRSVSPLRKLREQLENNHTETDRPHIPTVPASILDIK